MKRYTLFIIFTTVVFSLQAENNTSLYNAFLHPQDSARTKVWWFFGNTETTREGITADLEAFKQQGIGGVVYYDQVHGEPSDADELFSPQWWQHLLFAAKEAKRLGLTFDANITNGYAVGGKWITPDKSMQQLLATERVVKGGQTVSFRLPVHERGKRYHRDVAVLAVPYQSQTLGDTLVVRGLKEYQDDSEEQLIGIDLGREMTVRSISYQVNGRGKSAACAMQVPGAPSTTFVGNGYRHLPDIGELQVSDDGQHYRTISTLKPIYTSMGTCRRKTIAVPTTRGRFFRIRLHDWHSTDKHDSKLRFGDVRLSSRACVDQWEEKACLQTEFITDDNTPSYTLAEVVDASKVLDLTALMASDGTVTWTDAPNGQWLVVRLMSVPTGGVTKHGRPEGLGLECDKLSAEGAELHWTAYVQPLIDSIRTHHANIHGLLVDSHEAGSQNWTATFEQEFHQLRGYDLRRHLLVMAGFVVGSASSSARVLHDVRQTISDLVGMRYFATLQRLSHEQHIELTTQAIGGAICLPVDMIAVKQYGDKPQSEFWSHQTESTYDLKECSSAAHVYGRQIASAEAFTDGHYKYLPSYYKRLSDRATSLGINEFVACAAAHQPWNDRFPGNTYNGREYAFNRHNTFWPYMRGLWDYQARCAYLMRQGKPVSDFCLYLGDDYPVRLLTHRLPSLPSGFDYDAFTADALMHRMTVRDGRLMLPDGVSYSMMLLPSDGQLSDRTRQRIDELRRAGAVIYDPQSGQSLADAVRQAGLRPDVSLPHTASVYFAHRRTAQEDIYFLVNYQNKAVTHRFEFNVKAPAAEWWDPTTGERYALEAQPTSDGRTAVTMTLAPHQSLFVVFSQTATPQIRHRACETITTELPVQSVWQVSFQSALGGPSEPVAFESLTDWTKHADERIRHYSGTAVYQNTFTWKQKNKQSQYLLQLNLLNSVAEVIINGHSAGYVWCSPWEVDITKHLRKGKNHIEIRVANSWMNRLTADASLPENERITWCTHPIVKPNGKLTPSGLADRIVIYEHKQE